MPTTGTAHCEWCGREITLSPRGRRRKYCDQACRQRAYEHRRAESAGDAVPARSDDARAARLETLRDGLFELRCAAEDVETALREGADTTEVADMCREMVVKARALEHFR